MADPAGGWLGLGVVVTTEAAAIAYTVVAVLYAAFLIFVFTL